MLDLAFVRANLELVKEKLRARGVDPTALLGEFAELDAGRRKCITSLELLKAERNGLSEEVGKRKRAGEDAAAFVEQTRVLKEEIGRLDWETAGWEAMMAQSLAGIPNLPHDSVPPGKSE